MENRTLKEELDRFTPEPRMLAAWLVMFAAFIWFYWSSIGLLLSTWWHEEDYQHGFFVAPFAIFLLWHRREMLVPYTGKGSWWGLPILVLWAAMRWLSVYFNFGSLPEMSMIPFFAGMALFVGGWQALHWAWPAIVFLLFMIPLPGAVQSMASDQLQAIATRISLFVIQTLGIPAIAQGNVIQLPDKSLEVARACSGLRMLMLFFAICIGGAFVVQRPIWERCLIVVSAAPIAVVANVVRIVLTAIMFRMAHAWPDLIAAETAEKFMHDIAGWLMMPIGLILLWVELYLLSKLLIEPSHERPLVVGRMATQTASEPRKGRSGRPRIPPLSR